MQIRNERIFARQVLLDNGVAQGDADAIVAANSAAITAEAVAAVDGASDASAVGPVIAQLRQWVIANLVP